MLSGSDATSTRLQVECGNSWPIFVGVTQGKMALSENCNLHEILVAVCKDAAAAAGNQSVDILLDWPHRDGNNDDTRSYGTGVHKLDHKRSGSDANGGNIRISAREAGDCALIEVEDSGSGIPPEIYGRPFDPFVTAGKKDGLGLGLASRHTVREHGGDMWVEPASGARFVMRLPLSRVLTAAFHGTS
jgi:light-regulated signal transduction histidine kinase (bacteriophytochrome)